LGFWDVRLADVLRQDKTCIFRVKQSLHEHYCENHKLQKPSLFFKTLKVTEFYGNAKGLRNIVS
jgi:hypothetical protein